MENCEWEKDMQLKVEQYGTSVHTCAQKYQQNYKWKRIFELFFSLPVK